MSNIYKEAKKSFNESNSAQHFVEFESNIIYLNLLEDFIGKPFKLILLYGSPGVGKTMLLKKIAYEKKDIPLYYYERPFNNKQQLFKTVAKDIFGNSSKNLFTCLKKLESAVIVMLDEAQLYDIDMLETIRLLADTKKIKFVLSLHKNQGEELLVKEHFKTRILKTIQVFPPNEKEFHIYLQKKLFASQLPELSKQITKKVSKKIYHFTQGNLRESDKFMFILFDMLDYFYEHYPTKINSSKIEEKFIEMCAIQLGYIHA